MSRTSAIITTWLLTLCGALVAAPAAPQQPTSPASPSPSHSGLLLPAAPSARGLYLDATPTVSSAVVSPGKAFTLVLDVFPKAGIHVYAPGNRDYLPVALTIDTVSGVRIGPVRFPKSETFLFAPLKERVQVYSQPFRLTRSVTIDAPATPGASTGAPALTLTGRLEYQACDDKVCYVPQTLPLTWSVAIRR